MESRGDSSAAAADAGLMVGALDKYEESAFSAELGPHVTLQQPKRALEAGGDEYDEDEDGHGQSGLAAKDSGKLARAAKRSRRHNWQQKYECEFGLLVIERDAASGDVTLAMCGFCKTFGREGKYEQLVQADADTGNESKKRRRRSLTTTKFFRAFRVDNIRSHLQGAHPRRWAEYELLPKQDAVRARYLQVQGDLAHYDSLAMVDDVVLGGSALNTEADMAYVQAQAQALAAHSTLTEQHHAAANATATAQAVQAAQSAAAQSGTAVVAALTAASAPLSIGSHSTTTSLPSASQAYSSTVSAEEEHPLLRKRSNRLVAAGPRAAVFDYEKHLTEQLALDRQRLEFDKARFKTEVELKERELALQHKKLEQDARLHDKLVQATRETAEVESNKFFRLAEVLRESIASAQANSGASVV